MRSKRCAAQNQGITLNTGSTIFSGKKPCRKSLTAKSPSWASNVNYKRNRKAVVK